MNQTYVNHEAKFIMNQNYVNHEVKFIMNQTYVNHEALEWEGNLCLFV